MRRGVGELAKKEKKKTARSAEQIKKAYRRKKISVVCAIAFLYVVVVAAAAVIIDDRHVEIELVGDSDMTIEVGSQYEDPGAVAAYVGNLFGKTESEDEVAKEIGVDSSKIGDYTVRYSSNAFGKSTEMTRIVRVRDTTPPVIELNHVDGYLASWLVGYSEEGFTATDNYDGDITDRVIRTEVDGVVYYTVTDSSGNETSVERVIEYGISEPMIKLNEGEEIDVYASLVFTDPGFEALDESGNDLSSYVQVSGTVIPYQVGSYQLTYTVTNEQGETAVARRTVNIVPAPIPETVLPETKTIYLTFDDGPGPYTEQLLRVLAKYGVKATFFVTGDDEEYNYLIGRAYEDGHAIGVHTFTHDYSIVYSSERAFFDDFMKTEELIYEQTGTYTKLFRFPGGSSNTISRNYNIGIMSRLDRYMTDMGYVYFDWNVASGDAGETTSTYKVIENVTEGCSEHKICIVLQHDIKGFSVDAVESIIIWGRNNGYQFLPLDESSYGAHHSIAN